MKTILIITILFALSQSDLYSDDYINVYKDTTFVRKTMEDMDIYRLGEVIESDSAAYSKFETGNSYYTLANVFSSVGGFAVGYPLGTQLSDGEPNWTLAYVGLGTIGIGLILALISQDYYNDAIDLYIANIGGVSHIRSKSLPNFTTKGVGISIRF